MVGPALFNKAGLFAPSDPRFVCKDAVRSCELLLQGWMEPTLAKCCVKPLGDPQMSQQCLQPGQGLVVTVCVAKLAEQACAGLTQTMADLYCASQSLAALRSQRFAHSAQTK